MKILFISDASDMQGRLIEKQIKTYFKDEEVEFFNAKELDVKYCVGCFGCRIKTPGQCVITDDMELINSSYPNCDMFIILTKMKYGCYSSTIKKLLDRTIPAELPFLKLVEGQVHMKQRYSTKRSLLVVGYGDEINPDDAIIFHKLVKRNALNMDAQKNKVLFFASGEDVSLKINRIWSELK